MVPRAPVQLTLLFPTSSEPGRYDVEMRDSSVVKASAQVMQVSEIRSLLSKLH